VFWPDADVLSQQTWWKDPAWSGGPTLGALVEALRPALRAALLLGWQVDSIEVATGRATNQTTEWTSIELATLTVEPAKPLDVDKPFTGPNVHLGVFEVADLLGRIGEGPSPSRSPSPSSAPPAWARPSRPNCWTASRRSSPTPSTSWPPPCPATPSWPPRGRSSRACCGCCTRTTGAG
jgi:hypothetical protein